MHTITFGVLTRTDDDHHHTSQYINKHGIKRKRQQHVILYIRSRPGETSAVTYPVHACMSSACGSSVRACTTRACVYACINTCHSSHRFSACVHRSPVHACTYTGRPPCLRVSVACRSACAHHPSAQIHVRASSVRACVRS